MPVDTKEVQTVQNSDYFIRSRSKMLLWTNPNGLFDVMVLPPGESI